MNSSRPHARSAHFNAESPHDTAGGPSAGPRFRPLFRTAPGRVFALAGLVASGLAGTSAVLLASAQTAGAATPSPTCTSATCTVTFSETGAPVTWDVPDGASPLNVTLYGADGGLADGGGDRGSGGEVQAAVSASNGTALTISVGGTASFNSAGYNGGGKGETDSGAGGGATDLYEGATPVLVAGGGGGAGENLGSNGGGGGNADNPGGPGATLLADGATLGGGGGGGAGAQNLGGLGGPGGAVSGTSTCNPSTLTAGSSGNPGVAGAGGGGALDAGGGGGGGGGGYYGGGQGGGDALDGCGNQSATGGGGGGSSYTGGPGVSGVTVNDTPSFQASSLSGNGEAVISYGDPVATSRPSFDAVSGQALVVPAASGLLSAAAGTAGPPRDTLAVSLRSATTFQGGTVTLDGNGDGGFTYSPPANFTGTDTFSYTVTDTTDGAGDYATGTASIQVSPALQVTTSSVPGGQYGVSYDQSMGAAGGNGPYTWSVALGSLPTGLKLSPSGLISGTPTAPGTFGFSVKATDSSIPTAFSATQALSVTIAAAPLKITASSPAMAYGGVAPAITPIYDGFLNSDTAASLTTAPNCSTTATSSSPVGNYSSTCSGAFDPNYDITYANGSVSVGTALLAITANSTTMTYGGTVPVITATYGGFANGDSPASLSTPPTCSSGATNSSPVGTYPAICTEAVDPNYAIGYTAGTVTVTPAPLVITASNGSMTEGGPVPAITPVYGGWVNGDNAASLGTAPTCSTTATSSSLPGTYPATCRGAVGSNNAISYVAGTVTVNAASSGAPPAGTPSVGGTTGTPATGTPTTGTPAGEQTPAAFPHAWLSYPNGAVVNFAGQDYVFAGGRAFVTTGKSFGAIEKVDHAKAMSAPVGATAPTTVTPRSGTLITTWPVTGDPTIYVAGTDGQLHGFSTSGQFAKDGYDAALVVTVPSLGDASIGSTAGAEGAAANALATRADGAVVSSSGAFYVFAGGRAFSVPSAAALAKLRAADPARTLSGSVGAADTRAVIAGGVLLTASGRVYVSYQGVLYPFKRMAQLLADGYAGTAAVPVPGTGGLSVVTSYSGT